MALGFSLLGLASSGAAANIHYRLLSDPAYLSFCDVSELVNCTQVYSSPYGAVAGIPVAIFGAIWFGFATLLALAGLYARQAVRDNMPGYLFAGSTLALSTVIYLGYASFVVLHLVCVLCVLTYVATIGLFLVSGAVSGAASSLSTASLPRRVLSDLRVLVSSPLAVALTVLFLAGAASTLAIFPHEHWWSAEAAAAEPGAPAQDEAAQFERWYATQRRVPLVVPAEGAKVLVVKFNDYQCPPCRQTFMDYRRVLEKYEASQPGAVRLVLKDFPLDHECNSAVPGDFHVSACEAAAAVRMAREHGRAEALEESLFANQPSMTPESVRQVVRTVGQVTDFDARYQATLEAVKSDIAFGQQLGVRSTPTFFINGVMIAGGLPAHLFDQAIAYELQRAGTQ